MKQHLIQLLKKDFLLQFCLTLTYVDIVIGGPSEVNQMWEKIEREKAAGGYPWTHLQHNCTEEVWINPLNLPGDLSK